MTIDSASYAKIALSIADPAIQSRVGFGSFSKYRTLFERSHRLIVRSHLYWLPPSSDVSNLYWAIDPEYLHFRAMRHGGVLQPRAFHS